MHTFSSWFLMECAAGYTFRPRQPFDRVKLTKREINMRTIKKKKKKQSWIKMEKKVTFESLKWTTVLQHVWLNKSCIRLQCAHKANMSPNRVFTALKQVVDDRTMAASDMPTRTTQTDPDSTTKGVKAGRKRLQMQQQRTQLQLSDSFASVSGQVHCTSNYLTHSCHSNVSEWQSFILGKCSFML